LADVLKLDAVRRGEPRVVAGADRLDTRVRWVHAAEVTDIAHLLRGGELVLTTGIALPDEPDRLRTYIAELAQVGISGLIIELGRKYAHELPTALIRAAEENGVPLISWARETPFIEVTEAVHAQIIDAQLAELRASDQLHEVFTQLSVEGAPPTEVVRQVTKLAGRPAVLENLAHQVLAADAADADPSILLGSWETKSRAVHAEVRTAYDESSRWLITVVGARGEDWGRLILICDGPPSARDIVLVERAATTLALGRLLEQHAESLERQAHGSIISGILAHAYSDPLEAAARARAVGVPLNGRRLLGLTILPAGRDPGGRDPAGRDLGGRDPGGRDSGGRDLGGRDPGGRDSGGVDPGGRDSGGVDPGGRDPGERDPGGRDSGGRDLGGRDSAGRDAGRHGSGGRGSGRRGSGGREAGGRDSGWTDSGGFGSGSHEAMRTDPAGLAELAEATAGACREAGLAALVGILEEGAPQARVGVLVSLPGRSEIEKALGEVATRLRSRYGDAFVMAAGSVVESVRDVRRSFLEADQVADVAARRSDGRPFYRLPDLRLRGLLHLLRDDARLQTFVERELGSLLEYDAQRGSDLVNVLTLYLDSGRNKAHAAQRAHLSRPALYERLHRIERVLEVDLEDVESCASLHVALLALDSVRRQHP
jgi:Purine catabolism regulatory protein-like family/PucR C-terminal helix-turn-helix domain/GGDEF-like domain